MRWSSGHVLAALSLATGCAAYTGDSGELAAEETTGAPATAGGPERCAEPLCFTASLQPVEFSHFRLDDHDGDGRLDMLVALVDTFGVARGDGAGAFADPVALAERFDGYHYDFAGGDFDCDGVRDVVALSDGGSRAWLTLARGGPAGAETLYSESPGGGEVAVADFDGDGCDDAASTDAGVLRVVLGHPSGILRAVPAIGVGTQPRGIEAADLDGDGDVDLVVPNVASHDLSVIRGDGAGGFAPQELIAVGEGPIDVEADDLDGDGAIDLVVMAQRGLQVLRGRGDGGFAPPRSYALPLPAGYMPRTRGIAVCALNDDAHADLVLLAGEGLQGVVMALIGGPEASFVDLVVAQGRDAAWSLACRDLDGDGAPEIAYLVEASSQMFLRTLTQERGP